MRRCAKKTHTTGIIQIILLLVFSLRSYSVNGQISHRPEYDIVPGRRSGNVGGGTSRGGGNDGTSVAGDSGEDESISSQSNGIHTNGEILGPKSFPLSAQEPSCEELRAMWIFSKRQSRAAEMSNEIPTYRDPFVYNVWDPIYPTGRGIGSRTISHYREPTRPVFGRVISREPIVLQRLPVRTKIFDDTSSPKMYGSETRSTVPSIGAGSRLNVQYRFGGSYGNSQANNPNIVHQGSFQKLKELIWTERAKELTQQRKAEELAARAAALKEIAAGQLINRHSEQNDEPMANEKNLSPDQQDQHYHHSTDSRTSISKIGQKPIGMKSIFSSNPSNSNSVRSGRLLLPIMIGSDAKERGNIQRNFPMRPSHFRERNRSLYRQSTASDLYQRESRSDVKTQIPSYEHPRLHTNSQSYERNNDKDTADSINLIYQKNFPFSNSNDDFQQSLTDSSQQQLQQRQLLTSLWQKLYQIDQMLSSSTNSKFTNDYNNIQNNNRKYRNVQNIYNYEKHPLSSESISY